MDSLKHHSLKRPRHGVKDSDTFGRPRGFSLTEALVAMAIILALGSMAMAAVSAASSNGKKLRTRAVISKIDAIIAAQYAAYAGRNVDASAEADRGTTLRNIAKHDLPDTWTLVDDLAANAGNPDELRKRTGLPQLTPHQQAYVPVWTSLGNEQSKVIERNSSAECLFLAVMHGGLADCLDCDSLRIEVGDTDEDGMPEFLDAWNNPIGFVHAPSGLELPPGSGRTFFSSALPFDPVVATSLEARGGLMRPLIVSAGPDGRFGLESDAGPTPGSTESHDNLTNFDEEARP